MKSKIRFGLLPERHRVRLERVNDVGELDRIADEEHREVIADQIPVAILGIELDRKASRIAGDFRRVAAADDGREADRQRGLLARLLENFARVYLDAGSSPIIPVASKSPYADEAARVNDPLRESARGRSG